jgi:hypothetical protein
MGSHLAPEPYMGGGQAHVAYLDSERRSPLVPFEITPQGLGCQRYKEFNAWEASLQGAMTNTVARYLVEVTVPFGPWIHILVRIEHQLVSDNGNHDGNRVSGRIDPAAPTFIIPAGISPRPRR